ncbi:ACHA7 protein, partial [Polyodon spathula]|nr:ACHA7 protein [Polyodon spathula]
MSFNKDRHEEQWWQQAEGAPCCIACGEFGHITEECPYEDSYFMGAYHRDEVESADKWLPKGPRPAVGPKARDRLPEQKEGEEQPVLEESQEERAREREPLPSPAQVGEAPLPPPALVGEPQAVEFTKQQPVKPQQALQLLLRGARQKSCTSTSAEPSNTVTSNAQKGGSLSIQRPRERCTSILKSTCYIDVRWFPFDVQKCDLKFGSWTHNGWLLDLQMLEVDISTYIPNGEWDLVGVPAKRNELYYECCKEPYPDVTFTVTMRRRTLYYGLNLLIPCVLMSALALLVFLLPADSGEKISLGITVLLSLTVFMLLVAEIMPATSDSVPLIAQYFASTMVIVGLSVVVTVLVLQFHHHDPHGGKMPKWIRAVLLNWCAWFLRMKKPGEDRKHLTYKYNPHVHHSSASSIEMNVIPGQQSTNGNMNMTLSENIPEIAKILEEVNYIASRFRDQDEGEAICSEWKFAAAVVDRLCLVAFSLFSIICTITILMSAPNFIEAVSKDFT